MGNAVGLLNIMYVVPVTEDKETSLGSYADKSPTSQQSKGKGSKRNHLTKTGNNDCQPALSSSLF